MVVWLASYPRSGNTLLRTVLDRTTDLGSYSDAPAVPIVGLTNAAKTSFGHLDFREPWKQFYERAKTSSDIYPIKTHSPPCDDERAIYVVRDGRAATDSYAAYHESFSPNPDLCPPYWS